MDEKHPFITFLLVRKTQNLISLEKLKKRQQFDSVPIFQLLPQDIQRVDGLKGDISTS